MMMDKAKLGTRYTCFSCTTKFYDLNRPLPTCPECGTDQGEAPVRDIKSLLSGGGRPRPVEEPDPEPIKAMKGGEDDDDFDDPAAESDEDDDE